MSTSTPTPKSLWQHRPFRLYLTGQAASVAGSSLSLVVIPLLAVVELNASAAQVAMLAVAGQIPPLLVALHAGALADRRSKRTVMILSDLVSAAAIASIPICAALGALSLAQLAVVAAVSSTAAVFHDAAAISIVPQLVDRSLIQRGNSRISALYATAALGGIYLGAALVGLFGTARALLADTLSYCVSVFCMFRVKGSDITPVPASKEEPKQERVWRQIRDGLAYVYREPTLWTLTLVNATSSFTFALLNTLWPLFLLKTLHTGTTVFSFMMGAGAVGAALGAFGAPALTRVLGPGPVMLAALACTPLTQLPLLLARPGGGWEAAVSVGFFVHMYCVATVGTTQRSIRQCVARAGMMARMQAVSSWLTAGSRPLAAVTAGVVGTFVGIRPALAVGAVSMLVPAVVLYVSPVRGLRTMPVPVPTAAETVDPVEPADGKAGPQLPA